MSKMNGVLQGAGQKLAVATRLMTSAKAGAGLRRAPKTACCRVPRAVVRLYAADADCPADVLRLRS